jgi:hypothetical protein
MSSIKKASVDNPATIGKVSKPGERWGPTLTQVLTICSKGETLKIGIEDKNPPEPKDKVLDLLQRHHVEFDPNSDEAKRVLRKIDWRIMPMIFTIYLLQLMVSYIEMPMTCRILS